MKDKLKMKAPISFLNLKAGVYTSNEISDLTKLDVLYVRTTINRMKLDKVMKDVEENGEKKKKIGYVWDGYEQYTNDYIKSKKKRIYEKNGGERKS